MSDWTPQQIEDIQKYGLCEECGQPMQLYRGQYRNIEDADRLMLLCSADQSHSTDDVHLTKYPRHGMEPSNTDPTYGRIDRDIQWRVDYMLPESFAQRVAMEQTLQDKRDNSNLERLAEL